MRRWTREVKPVMRLALPIMGGMISQMLVGLSDTIMVGWVGVVPLAASSFVNNLVNLPFIFGMGLLSSIAVLASHAFGARQSVQVGELLRGGLVLSVLVGLGTALVVFLLRPFLGLFRQPPEVVGASGLYMCLVAVSIVPALIGHGCKQFSEAVNQPWVPALILLGGVLLNILLNWVLIFGHWGAPALGLEGAGWATLVSRIILCAAFLVFLFQSSVLRAMHPARWWTAGMFASIRPLVAVGWPVGAQHLLEVGAFTLAGLMVGWINAESIAAHQVAITCASMSFMFALGIGSAACIRVGQMRGARQYPRMRRIGILGIILSALVMSAFGLLFMTAGRPLAHLFIESPGVVALAAQLLVLAAIFQVADGIQIASMSALRGLADVRLPMCISALAYWVIALPMGGFLAFSSGRGAVGIWIGMAFGLGVAALALALRFIRQSKPARWGV